MNTLGVCGWEGNTLGEQELAAFLHVLRKAQHIMYCIVDRPMNMGRWRQRSEVIRTLHLPVCVRTRYG